LGAAGGGLLFQFLADDVVAQLHAFIADEHAGARDQLADFVLALAAERAVKDLAAFVAAARPVLAHLVLRRSVVLCVIREGPTRPQHNTAELAGWPVAAEIVLKKNRKIANLRSMPQADFTESSARRSYTVSIRP